MRAPFLLPLVSVLLMSPSGCHTSHASEGRGLTTPPGEAWLTPQQVRAGKIEYAEVDEQSVDDTVSTTGKVTFDDQRVAHVYSPVNGRVRRVSAQLGAHVDKDATLAVIDSADIGVVSSDLRKATADLVAAERDYERLKELYRMHAASLRELEISEDNYRRARAEMARAQQKAYLLRAGSFEVSQGYALISPIAGEVFMRNVSPGIEIQGQYGGGTAAELFTVGALDRVWVIADVFEVDVARVSVGAKASVKVVAYADKAFEGTVDWVSGMLDPVTRTIKIRCTFDNPERLLKPEMYATVLVGVAERRALAIPRTSLMRLGDQTVVFVKRSDAAPDGRLRFERIPVAVDEDGGTKWLAVTHGLDKGDQVVNSGGAVLSGML